MRSQTRLPESPTAAQIYKRFGQLSGLRGLPFEVKERTDGEVLVIRVNNPTDRLFKLLGSAEESASQDSLFPTRATLDSDSPADRLARPEAQLYLKVLSESLAVTRDSFRQDFFERYIPSVFGAEQQVLSEANHILFGRRGSGKSSLMLYALLQRENAGEPSAWIELQVYQSRNENQVIADVLWEVLNQFDQFIVEKSALSTSMSRLKELSEVTEYYEIGEIQRLLPDIKRLLGGMGRESKSLFIFIDDLHVLPLEMQPALLGTLNAIARGNGIYLKISSIESFTRTWDAGSRQGLEVTHDAQVLRLDYNLTKPAKAHSHIQSILDAHAVYSGLSSARYICTDADVIDRLVWTAAGVPRDALNIFSQAITAARVDDRPRVTVTNINQAASEAVNDKLRDVQLDGSGHYDEAMELLEHIRRVCIQQRKSNAFLVEIQNDDPTYEGVRRLIDLRLLHVIHEGITVKQAGRKYVAMILDYGFYVGVRAAKSIDLFRPPAKRGQYEELRALPIIRLG